MIRPRRGDAAAGRDTLYGVADDLKALLAGEAFGGGQRLWDGSMTRRVCCGRAPARGRACQPQPMYSHMPDSAGPS